MQQKRSLNDVCVPQSGKVKHCSLLNEVGALVVVTVYGLRQKPIAVNVLSCLLSLDKGDLHITQMYLVE